MSTTKGLRFSPAAHRYWLDGKPVPGVTTILGVLDKPALPKWAAKSVAEHVADSPDSIAALRDLGRDAMVKALAEVPWKRRDDAAERGTKFHEYAQRILLGEHVDVPDPLVPLVERALDFMDTWDIQPILTETAVASREHWYAGTLDLVAEYRRPDSGSTGCGIFDWKSSKRIYPNHAFQFNAYAFAEFYGLGGDEKLLADLGIGAAYGVHVRDDGWDVYPVEFGRNVFAEFLTIRKTYDINKRAEGDWKVPGSGYIGRAITEGTAA